MPRLSIRSNNNTNMVQCKKHPKHKQSPGVCSLCLGEKLSRVSTSNVSSSRDRYASRAREYYCSSSSVSSSEDESSYASSCVSPPAMHDEEGRRRRIVSDVDLNLMKYLSKSKSMPLGKVDVDKKKKVFGGFWSKFLRPRKYNHHNLKNVDIISNNNNNVNNKVYMSQPLDVASSSSMAVC